MFRGKKVLTEQQQEHPMTKNLVGTWCTLLSTMCADTQRFVSRLQKKDVFLPSPKKEIAKISDAFLRWSVLIHSGCFTRLSFFSMCFGWLCWWHTLEKSWFRRNHHHVKRCNIESIESGFLFGSLEIIRWKCQQKHTFYQKTSTSHQLRAYRKASTISTRDQGISSLDAEPNHDLHIKKHSLEVLQGH